MQSQVNLMRRAAAITLAAVAAAGAVSSANAQPYGYRAPTGGGLGSIVSCDAPGGKQAGGALIGALLGAAAGSNLAKHDRGTGTAIGAVVGAATGSYVGCKMQRDRAETAAYSPDEGYGPQPATYAAGGYTLSSAIAPAAYVRDGGWFMADTAVTLRAAPTRTSAKVGRLSAGQRFRALAQVRGTDWVLVGQGGVGVGYVHGAYVRPAASYQYAAYRR